MKMASAFIKTEQPLAYQHSKYHACQPKSLRAGIFPCHHMYLAATERWSEQLLRGWGHIGENITRPTKKKSQMQTILVAFFGNQI